MCAQGLNFALRIGSMMMLARALEPSDFGLVGMVTAVTGAFSLFKDAGLSVVTVQRAVITDDEISALFWVNMLVGVVLTLFCLAAAPALVAFYGEPRLFWVASILGTGFVLNAAGVQHSAILQRQMRFVALAVNDTLSWLASVIIGIGLGLGLLRGGPIEVVWVSGRISDSTTLRATELRISELIQVPDGHKVPPFAALLERRGLSWDQVAFVGDDLADVAMLRKVGVPIAVANAVPEVKALAMHVTSAEGGQGAVREAVSWLLTQRGEYESAVNRYVDKRAG